MKKTFLLFILLFSFIMLNENLYAGRFVVTQQPATGQATYDDELPEQVTNNVNNINNNALMKKLGSQPLLSESMAEATASANNTGVLYSGGDVKLVSVSVGAGLGVGGNVFKVADSGNIKKDGDIEKGFVAVPVMNVTVNGQVFNTPWSKDFLFSVKGGYLPSTSFSVPGGDMSYESMIVGVGTQYKLINNPYSKDLFHIRPITLNTGINYISSKAVYNTMISKSSNGKNAKYITDTDNDLKIESSAFIIPVEVTTSAKALYGINLILGLGTDLTFGETKISASTSPKMRIIDNQTQQEVPLTQNLEGRLENTETKKSMDIFRPKIITGIGVNTPYVKFDVPVVYYPISQDAAVGVVFGVVF